MALYMQGPFSGKTVGIPNGATSTALGDPGDNCHTIIVYNPDAAEIIYLGWGYPGGNIAVGGGAMTVAARIPPQTSMTIPIGRLSNRLDPGGSELVGQHGKGSGIDIYITYIYGLES